MLTIKDSAIYKEIENARVRTLKEFYTYADEDNIDKMIDASDRNSLMLYIMEEMWESWTGWNEYLEEKGMKV